MIHLTRSVLRTMKTSSAILSLLLVAAAPNASAADGKLVIEAGKIVTLTGEVIENGKIVIEEGIGQFNRRADLRGSDTIPHGGPGKSKLIINFIDGGSSGITKSDPFS